MQFKPALHKLRTAIHAMYPSKHHPQQLTEPSKQPARNLTQNRPTALIRSRSKQEGSGSPTPSSIPGGKRFPQEAPPRIQASPAAPAAGAGVGAGGREGEKLCSHETHPGPLCAPGASPGQSTERHWGEPGATG